MRAKKVSASKKRFYNSLQSASKKLFFFKQIPYFSQVKQDNVNFIFFKLNLTLLLEIELKFQGKMCKGKCQIYFVIFTPKI